MMKTKTFSLITIINLINISFLILCFDNISLMILLLVVSIITNYFCYVKIKKSLVKITSMQKIKIVMLEKNITLFAICYLFILILNLMINTNSSIIKVGNVTIFLFMLFEIFLFIKEYLNSNDRYEDENKTIEYLLKAINLLKNKNLQDSLKLSLKIFSDDKKINFNSILDLIVKENESYLLLAQNSDNTIIEKLCICIDDYHNEKISKELLFTITKIIEKENEERKIQFHQDLIIKNKKTSSLNLYPLNIFVIFLIVDFIFKLGGMFNA